MYHSEAKLVLAAQLFPRVTLVGTVPMGTLGTCIHIRYSVVLDKRNTDEAQRSCKREVTTRCCFSVCFAVCRYVES